MSNPIYLCAGCGCEYDPDVCWCGGYMKDHSATENHQPTPLGCECGYDKSGAILKDEPGSGDVIFLGCDGIYTVAPDGIKPISEPKPQ